MDMGLILKSNIQTTNDLCCIVTSSEKKFSVTDTKKYIFS